jgi:hypothetical protein
MDKVSCLMLTYDRIEPPVEVVDHLGQSVFAWTGSGVELADSSSATAGGAPAVFSVSRQEGRAGRFDGAGCGTPWYAEGSGATVERRCALQHDPAL